MRPRRRAAHYCFFLVLLLVFADPDADFDEADFVDLAAVDLPDFDDAVLLPLAPLRLLLAEAARLDVGTAGAAAGSLMVAPLVSCSSYASIMPSS